MVIKILFLPPFYIWAFIMARDALARPVQENTRVESFSYSSEESGDIFLLQKAHIGREKRDASSEQLMMPSASLDEGNQIHEDNSFSDTDDIFQILDISTTPEIIHQDAISHDREPMNSNENENFEFQQGMLPDLDGDTESELIGGDGILLESTSPPLAVDQHEQNNELEHMQNEMDTGSVSDRQSENPIDADTTGEDNTNSDHDLPHEFVPSDERDGASVHTDAISDESSESNSTLNGVDLDTSSLDETGESSSQTGNENTMSHSGNEQQGEHIHHLDGSSLPSDHDANLDLTAEDNKVDDLKLNHSVVEENYTLSAQDRTVTMVTTIPYANSSTENNYILINISSSVLERHVTSSLNAISSGSDSTESNDIIYSTLQIPTRPANSNAQSTPRVQHSIPLQELVRSSTSTPERHASIPEPTTTSSLSTSVRSNSRSTQTNTSLPAEHVEVDTRGQNSPSTTESTPTTSLPASRSTSAATVTTRASPETLRRPPSTSTTPIRADSSEISTEATTTRVSTETLRTPPSTSTTPVRAEVSETDTPTTINANSDENKNGPTTCTATSSPSTDSLPVASSTGSVIPASVSITIPIRPHPTHRTVPTPTTSGATPQQSSDTTTGQSFYDSTTADHGGAPWSFVELKLHMNRTDFCTHQTTIRQELVEIISRGAQDRQITYDQIQFLNPPERMCGMPISDVGQELDQTLVQMYLVDKLHNYDVCLTNKSVEALQMNLGHSSSNILQSRLIGAQLLTETISFPKPGGVRSGDGENDRQNPGGSNGEKPGKDGGNAQYSKTKSSDPFSDPGVVAAVVLASIGIFSCLAVFALQIAVRRRNHLRVTLKRTIQRSMSVTSADSIQLGEVTKSRPNSGLFNPALDITDSLEPTHEMNYSQLANFCSDESKVLMEFEKLPNRMPRLSVVPTGEEDKNRFANVLPLTLTRVKLLQDGPDPRSSYINANYITGPDNQCQYYIATQAPTEDTIADFWTMVWQQGTKAIVMLTQMEEDGQNKCTPYWPDFIGKSAAQKHGDFLIELKNKDVCQEYIASELQITHLRKIESRPIFHFWYTCWPTKSLPEPISLVKLVLDSRTKYEDGGTPLIVHCSPGTGRTGTFIALDLCMHQFETRRTVNVMKTVYSLRQERAGAVQSKEQYNLLYQAAREYASIIESPGVSAASSATTLHALLQSS